MEVNWIRKMHSSVCIMQKMKEFIRMVENTICFRKQTILIQRHVTDM